MRRIATDGKHLALDGRPFRLRGATYGTFAPRADGALYPETQRAADDFAAMAQAGLNTVRTYTLPPEDVLDAAATAGLRLLVGLDYHDWRLESDPGRRANRRICEAGRRAVADALERCAERPEVVALAVGNEVPGDLVRMHGAGPVEEILSELVAEVHSAGAGLLATYVNYPTTEYLRVEGQDFCAYNVFLEDPHAFGRYLRHLQIVSGDRPLVLTELGLAAGIHGEEAQAAALEWQLRLCDENGCAGATVFSWTDEWAVAGEPVTGWGFGLTDEDRRARPALEVVSRWAGSRIRDLRREWPRVTAVVCAYNGDKLIEECLESLRACDYPNLEVIVCDDGSTDRTRQIARRFPFRLIELPRMGLSGARNAGIEAASGDVIAFMDADAACHPEWPYHLVLSLEDENVVATGGPNLPVPGVGFVERVVSRSPGGPVEVLVGDDRAEHVPGCNMAFRREALEEIGGFDPIYTAAGDDVDVCWKLLDRGHEIAFAPAAQVLHHRRSSVRGYLHQQRSYGRSERLLSGSHRHRFNRLGQARWKGFIYGGLELLPSIFRPVVYHGPLGMAPFQKVVRRRGEAALATAAALLPLLVPVAALGVLAAVSTWFLLAPALALATLVAYAGCVAAAATPPRGESRPLAFRALTAFLHVAQPLVRAWGRLRSRAPAGVAKPVPAWNPDRAAWLEALERDLTRRGLAVRFGNPHGHWDLEASVGPLLAHRLTTAVAWHWHPLGRAALRPRRAALAALAVALAVTAFDATAGGAALALLAFAAILEGALLRRRVRSSLRVTTRGSISSA